MNILVVGNGGREHAIAWKLNQDSKVEQIFTVSVNTGIRGLPKFAGGTAPEVLVDNQSIAVFARACGADLVVVGPEAPLRDGLVDALRAWQIPAFGIDRNAAILEADKGFAKLRMLEWGVPTAEPFDVFDDPDEAIAYIKAYAKPVYVKAVELAAGKGARPGRTVEEAIQAVQDIMVRRAYGESVGREVVVEALLEGEEASFTVLTDGNHCLPFVSSQDHKMSHDGDKGKNTGGMGAYSPAPVITPELHTQIMDEIVYPAVHGMRAEGRLLKGVVYVGLMITEQGPKVLEFNCRFGDPEMQVLLPRMKSDLVPVLDACIDGTLDQVEIEWRDEAAACVVIASGGYPDRYETGKVITGLEQAEALEDVTVFHAGTKLGGDDGDENRPVVTNGGRVLGVTALGSDLKAAIDQAYCGVAEIGFDQAHFRRDIGWQGLARLG